MDDTTITIYCLCEEFLEAIGHRDDPQPVGPGPVGEVAEDDTQGVAGELSNPRYDAGYESASSEEARKGPVMRLAPS